MKQIFHKNLLLPPYELCCLDYFGDGIKAHGEYNTSKPFPFALSKGINAELTLSMANTVYDRYRQVNEFIHLQINQRKFIDITRIKIK